MKILVIEDDPETASYIVNGLKKHGHTLDHASDGKEGLFLAAESLTTSLSSTGCCRASTDSDLSRLFVARA